MSRLSITFGVLILAGLCLLSVGPLQRHVPNLTPISRFRHSEVSTDLPRQRIGNFPVPGHCGTAVIGRIAPPRVATPLTDHDAPVAPQVGDELVPFHAGMLTSS